jgi:serine/threonine protein kinase
MGHNHTPPDLDMSAVIDAKSNTMFKESSPKRVRFDVPDGPPGSSTSKASVNSEADSAGQTECSYQSCEAGETGEASVEKDGDNDKTPTGPLYMFPSFDDVENIEYYRPGGYHPVRIGDRIGGRYKIIHKLGYGGFRTVWLARDTEKQRYVALKITLADFSKDAMEKDLKILKHLAEHVERPGGIFVEIPIEDFWITGPNGKHLCIVSEVAGPSIAHLTRTYNSKIEPQDARRMALQITQCLAFLHSGKVGVVHGDLTTSNVLLELGNLDSLPQDKLLGILGEPVGEQVRPYTDKTLGPSAPNFLYHSAAMTRLSSFFTGNIIIIDFGNSFFLDKPPAGLSKPPAQFCSPEFILQKQKSRSSDVWALACTIFEVRAGSPLFESFIFGDEDVLESMIGILGPLPEQYLPYLEKEGYNWLKDVEGDGEELGDMVDHIKGILEDEKIALCGLLRQALRYDVEERLTADEVLRHPWFSFQLQVGAKESGSGHDHVVSA